MGNEIGMFREWDEQKGTDWFLLKYPMHAAFEKFFEDLTGIYADNDAYYFGYDPTNFQWINADDASRNLFSFMRKSKDKTFITILNFSTNPYKAQFGVPHKGIYREILNSQWSRYNGTLIDETPQAVKALRLSRNNFPYMIEINVPALGGQIFVVDNPVEKSKK